MPTGRFPVNQPIFMETKIKVYAKAQNRAALGIIRAYAILHPEATLDSLREEFPHSVCPDSGVKENFIDINEISSAQGQNWNGYLSKEHELIPLADGTRIALTNMWTGKSLKRLTDMVAPMGIELCLTSELPKQNDPIPGNSEPVSSKTVRYCIEYVNGFEPASAQPAAKPKLFSDDDFDKQLGLGDEFVFDKPELNKLRVELVWSGTDLDLCAFMLGPDGVMQSRDDLVYFNSQLRWKPARAFDDPDFNPLDGQPSTWEKDSDNYKNQRKWLESTLPLSADGSVIGSWDDNTADEGTDCGERLHVLLEEVDVHKYSSIVLAAVVAKAAIAKGHTLANANDPVVYVYNAETDELVFEYHLAKEFADQDAVCFGLLEYDSQTMQWSFTPQSDAYKGGLPYLATEVFS